MSMGKMFRVRNNFIGVKGRYMRCILRIIFILNSLEYGPSGLLDSVVLSCGLPDRIFLAKVGKPEP